MSNTLAGDDSVRSDGDADNSASPPQTGFRDLNAEQLHALFCGALPEMRSIQDLLAHLFDRPNSGERP